MDALGLLSGAVVDPILHFDTVAIHMIFTGPVLMVRTKKYYKYTIASSAIKIELSD